MAVLQAKNLKDVWQRQHNRYGFRRREFQQLDPKALHFHRDIFGSTMPQVQFLSPRPAALYSFHYISFIVCSRHKMGIDITIHIIYSKFTNHTFHLNHTNLRR